MFFEKKSTKKVNKIMLYTTKEANEDIKSMYPILNTLKKLVLAFGEFIVIQAILIIASLSSLGYVILLLGFW